MQNRRGLVNDKLRKIGNTRSYARGEKQLALEFNLLMFSTTWVLRKAGEESLFVSMVLVLK
jgi:hypothetical protein